MVDLPKVTLKPPEPLNLTNTPADANAWRLWRSLWESYSTITMLEDSDRLANFARAVLMGTIGMRTVTLYSKCESAATDTVAQILDKIQGRIVGVRSETFDRYNSRKQQPNESVDTYVAALRLMIDQCNYTANNLKDSLIRNRIVMGISDETTRARLLQTPELTLRSCIDTCRTFEAAREQLHSISHPGGETSEPTGLPVHVAESKKRNTDTHRRQCRYCGNQHEMKKEKFPAWGKTCANCNKKNHFKAVCRSRSEEPTTLHTVATYKGMFTVATNPFAKNKSPPCTSRC
ncbi:uncharacterized protein [Watersipora subatra]|uniref:uncharacterized protein n=1 Tax=Watersipora subatra TaxID=2589382 RepID=UPI00355B2CFD